MPLLVGLVALLAGCRPCEGDACDTDCPDPVVWHADRDRDGYGSVGDVLEACEAPPGYLADATDCNDTFASIHPGADEACNQIDDDCDGAIDPDGSTGAATFYTDADRDGYGDPGAPVQACVIRAGLVEDASDCDDTTDARSPAVPEACDDGVDNDCDGGSNDCGPAGDIDLATAVARFDGVSAGNYAARAVALAGDVDGDGTIDLLIGAHGLDRGSWSKAGAAYLALGPHSGSKSLRGSAATLRGTSAGDFAGWAVASAGDVDGDGTIDLLIGGLYHDGNGADSGGAWLVSGATRGDVGLEGFPALPGEGAGHRAGSAVAAGDVDGDGGPDLVVGAPGFGSDAGAVYVAGDAGPLADADARLDGDAGSLAGHALALGDVDGDGRADVIVGAPGRYAGTGAVFVVVDPRDGLLSDVGDRIDGVYAGDAAGTAVAAGDVDGDGKADVVVGAPGNGGAAYVVLSPTPGSLAAADAVLIGASGVPGAGWSLALADVDGDGRTDLLVGAADGYSNPSATHLVLGPVQGTFDLGDARARYTSSSLQAGGSVAAGDIDGDGYDDVVVGAPDDASYAGAAFLFLGQGM